MFLPRVFSRFSSKAFFSTKVARAKPKVSKVEDLKRINYENQLIFGDLLETQKERRERLSKSHKTDPSDCTTALDKENLIFEKTVTGSDPCASVDSTEQVTTESSKDESTKSKKKGKVKKDEDKANKAACETKSKKPRKSGETAKVATKVCLSQESGEPVDTKVESGGLSTDLGSSIFSLENETKADLEIKQDTELIVGRNITKSDKFYKYPSVTKILSLTMSESSKSALFRWRSRLIAEMGEEKFQEFHAKQLHLGSLFHSSLQEYLQLTPRSVSTLDPELEGCWKSLEKVLPRLAGVKLLESHVVHEKLKYRGVIDCIASYSDSPLIIEWKKSSKSKSNLAMTYDAPVQLAAYIGALNYDSTYPFKVSRGLVVVAYSDGAAANVFPLTPSELQLHWKAWMERYKKFTDMVEIDSS